MMEQYSDIFNNYNSSPVSISLYTTFTVLPPSTSLSNTFTLCPDVHLDNPTYNCPCEKTDFLKSNPTFWRDFPWFLLTVIANASRIRNCLLLSGIGKSSTASDNVIWGINTTFPVNLLSPLIILHFNTLLLIANTLSLVPLQSHFEASKFLSSITGHPIFNFRCASGSKLDTKEFRYSTEYGWYSFISSSCNSTESALNKTCSSPGNFSNYSSFRSITLSFIQHRMFLSKKYLLLWLQKIQAICSRDLSQLFEIEFIRD